ncbi:MAG: sigma-54 dependent transcriptional regulator [Pseudomonadota bacterium]|nr:sigma-54 dependent transcriptional regulator [Pseudomonadota bacterium]
MKNRVILVVDDEAVIRSTIHEILSDEGYQVRTAANGSEAKKSYLENKPDLILLDIWMPDIDGITLLKQWTESNENMSPVVIMSGHGNIETAVEATRLGAVDYIEKPLALSQLLRTVEATLDELPVVTNLSSLALSKAKNFDFPQGKSEIILKTCEEAEIIARHNEPVLLTGEPGSGRATFARFIHSKSDRFANAFIEVNGAELIEAGAADFLVGIETAKGLEEGLFGQAVGGTLFINDFQELGAKAQTLILNLIQNNAYIRIGDTKAATADIRVIAGVNTKSGDNEIRADLLASIAVLQLKVPSLRDYLSDVPELLRFYIDKITSSDSLQYRSFTMAAQNRLRNYFWPGNLRELESFVRRVLISGAEKEITLAEVEQQLGELAFTEAPLLKKSLLDLPMREAREQFEKAYLKQQLSLVDGKVGKMAKRVGMERTHLYRKLRALGVGFHRTDNED